MMLPEWPRYLAQRMHVDERRQTGTVVADFRLCEVRNPSSPMFRKLLKVHSKPLAGQELAH